MLVVVVEVPRADDIVFVDEAIPNFEEIWALIVKLAIKVEEGGPLPIHDVVFPMRVVVCAPLLHLGPPRTHLIALEDCPSRGVTHGWVLWIPNKPKVAMQRLVEVLGSLVFLSQAMPHVVDDPRSCPSLDRNVPTQTRQFWKSPPIRRREEPLVVDVVVYPIASCRWSDTRCPSCDEDCRGGGAMESATMFRHSDPLRIISLCGNELELISRERLLELGLHQQGLLLEGLHPCLHVGSP